MRALAGDFTAKLAGVSFAPGYPEALFTLEHRLRFVEARTGGPPAEVPVQLRRDPDNPVDSAAVAVCDPDLGRLGHIPAGLAARLAPELDAGIVWRARVHNVAIHPVEPLHPGLEIHLERQG